MTPLFMILGIAALFAVLLAYESAGDHTQPRLNPAGLLTWLVSGNWPAKVGAALVIIGVGALLRYAFANFIAPPEVKLGVGMACSAALGLASAALRERPMRRAIHLALAGAAFGVAYLTAYSAYGFFNYITDVNALSLLALVAVGAGVFAISSNAMSVAILAMIGAYIAPRFAIGSPGILPVYGYYLAASTLTLIMVTLRGWRPLIHLSFLFTLAAGLFFGWSGKFYAPEYFGTMQPLLLALALVHVAMPLLESQHPRSAGLSRFDSAYFVALPLVTAALTLKIAPQLRPEGALGIAGLAIIWALTAALLYGLKRDEAPRHAFVATLLGLAAFFFYQQNLPWALIGIGFSVAILSAAPILGWPRSVQQLACAAATFLGVWHVIGSILQPTPATPFLNELFAHRMTASVLMIIGAVAASRQSLGFGKILGVSGIGWALLSIVAELMRLHIDFLPQLVYGVLLGAIVLSVAVSEKLTLPPVAGGLLVFLLAGCGWWAVDEASEHLVQIYLGLTTLALLAMAWSGRDSAGTERSDFSAALAIGLLPFALLPWAIAYAEFQKIDTNLFEASVAMAGIVVAGLSARLWLSTSPRWNERIQPLHVYFAALALLWLTLFHIERGIWPVAFEVLALGYLIAYVMRRSREQAEIGFGVGAMMVLSVALVIQAMLLRAYGPDTAVMHASDINRMHLPAVASLMWAVFGGSLAWWGSYSKSRTMWSAGAVLLVIAAIKLVFFDFGELGQLGNIIAFIASGGVFLAVAWFAPIPPKGEAESISPAAPSPERWMPTQPNPDWHAAAAPSKTDLRSNVASDTPENNPTKPDVEPVPAVAPPPSPSETPFRATNVSQGSRYKRESQGINGLWFLFLGLAISIALIATGWHKQKQRKKAYEHYQQQLRATQPPQPAPPPPAPPAFPSDTPARDQAPAAAPYSGNTNRPLAQAQRGASNPAGRSTEFARRSETPSVLPPVAVIDACTRFTEQLPQDYVVYAGGEYKGKEPPGAQRHTRSPGRFDVTVDAPGKPVVLALGAYEPSLWNIRVALGTRLAGIVLSGYHTQTLQEAPLGIPTLNISYESRSPCGYFYLTREGANRTAASIQKILGQAAESYTLAHDGRIDIGRSSVQSTSAFSTSNRASPSVPSPPIERRVDRDGRIIYDEKMR